MSEKRLSFVEKSLELVKRDVFELQIRTVNQTEEMKRLASSVDSVGVEMKRAWEKTNKTISNDMKERNGMQKKVVMVVFPILITVIISLVAVIYVDLKSDVTTTRIEK